MLKQGLNVSCHAFEKFMHLKVCHLHWTAALANNIWHNIMDTTPTWLKFRYCEKATKFLWPSQNICNIQHVIDFILPQYENWKCTFSLDFHCHILVKNYFYFFIEMSRYSSQLHNKWDIMFITFPMRTWVGVFVSWNVYNLA